MPNTHETLTSLFSDIADAIRAKTGDSAEIVADEFPDAISEISGGDGGAYDVESVDNGDGTQTINIVDADGAPVIEPLTVTANGTYTAPSGKAYSPVVVNAPSATEPYIEETYDASGRLTAATFQGYAKIREHLFYNCYYLESVSMPNIQRIEASVFYSCGALQIPALPNELVYIGTYAFYNCGELKLASLPSNLSTIDDFAFYRCDEITITNFPNSLRVIGEQAFRDCTSLAISSLPSGVTTIRRGAFMGCTSIATITIPSSLSTIEYELFSGCSNLREVTFIGKPTTMRSNPFASCTKLTTINVPWASGEVAGAPWGATNATINYNYTGA